MTKKITRRQHQFLSQFLDMYQEIDKPIHYVAFAKRLDIGKVTAYEMLRLLEKRGLVEVEYHLPPGDRGPGRSTVLFQPTQKAIQLINQLSEGTVDSEAWESARTRILQRLLDGKVDGYDNLISSVYSKNS
jgi:predicted ArsR family transcriptional regulator